MAGDFYQSLGVGRDASEAEVKSAYRKLAKQYHPDRTKGDKEAEKRFKEIGEAYAVLKDKEKRRAYDQLGHAAFTQGGGQGFGAGFGEQFAKGFSGGFGGGFSSAMGDIFEDIFGGLGGQRQRGRAGRGEDLRMMVELSLTEAFAGGEKELAFSAPGPCPSCKASGSASGSAPQACPRCQGSGTLHARQGFFTLAQHCPACGGEGQMVADACAQCGGEGRVEEKRKVRVKLPAGIAEEAQLRLAGKGACGRRGAQAGDLYLLVSITPHPFFTRRGDDLLCEIRTSFTHAALGGEGRLETLDGGKLKVKIPEGAQDGHVLRLGGQGMPVAGAGGRRGDLLVRLKLETPVRLTAEQKNLLRQLRASETKSNRPKEKGFFARARDFFDTLRP